MVFFSLLPAFSWTLTSLRVIPVLQVISPAALFLAAKVEEQPRKLEHVIKVAHACLNPQDPSPDIRSDVSTGCPCRQSVPPQNRVCEDIWCISTPKAFFPLYCNFRTIAQLFSHVLNTDLWFLPTGFEKLWRRRRRLKIVMATLNKKKHKGKQRQSIWFCLWHPE